MKLYKCWATIALIVLLLCAGIEYLSPGNQASLLLNLAFWLGLGQGCVALIAVGELAHFQWIQSLKAYLFRIIPLIFVCALLIPLLLLQWNLYPGSKLHSFWFEPDFFIGRNFVAAMLTFLFALRYKAASISEHGPKRTWAVLYLFSFVLSQCLMAYDCVMSLEYPWFSTIYGPYFVLEAIYVGIACAGLICFFVQRKAPSIEFSKAQYGSGWMMFVLSVLWMCLCAFQLTMIWHENLPKEVGFYKLWLRNIHGIEIVYATVGLLFLIPFLALATRNAKQNRYVVACASISIFFGIWLERIFMIGLLVPVDCVAVLVKLLLLLGFTLWTFSACECVK